MRTYQVQCIQCMAIQDTKIKPSEFKTLKTDGVPCTVCSESRAYLYFDPAQTNISFKGDVWSDKNHRELDYREKRSNMLSKKQKDSHWVPSLQPNVDGELVDSWEDAQKLASSKGKATDTYSKYVNKGS